MIRIAEKIKPFHAGAMFALEVLRSACTLDAHSAPIEDRTSERAGNEIMHEMAIDGKTESFSSVFCLSTKKDCFYINPRFLTENHRRTTYSSDSIVKAAVETYGVDALKDRIETIRIVHTHPKYVIKEFCNYKKNVNQSICFENNGNSMPPSDTDILNFFKTVLMLRLSLKRHGIYNEDIQFESEVVDPFGSWLIAYTNHKFSTLQDRQKGNIIRHILYYSQRWVSVSGAYESAEEILHKESELYEALRFLYVQLGLSIEYKPYKKIINPQG